MKEKVRRRKYEGESKVSCSLFHTSYFILLTSYFLLHTSYLMSASPWGKDADLVKRSHCAIEAPAAPFLGEHLIRFHQEVISPADGPRSHFKPSSSQYTREAMRKYGFLRGFLMGCDRLMRENKEPWIYPTVPGDYGFLMKWDPVK